MPGKVDTDKIREMMNRSRTNGTKISKEIGMTRSGVSLILCTGRTSQETAEKLADALGCWLYEIYTPVEDRRAMRQYNPQKAKAYCHKKVLELCNAHGVHLKDVAQATGYSIHTLYNYSLKGRQPSFKLLCKIADYFGVSPTVFLED